MPDRVANIVILVEDIEQQNLVFRFLERCDRRITYRDCRFERAAKRSGGSGEQFVRNQYPVEVKEHRLRVGKGASALLVVMVDADKETVQGRASQLSVALKSAGEGCLPKERLYYRRLEGKELIVVLIPRRHVETWIRALLGNQVIEEQNYKNPEPTPKEIREAAETLYAWTRPNASAGPTSTASLTQSIPEWRKIPS